MILVIVMQPGERYFIRFVLIGLVLLLNKCAFCQPPSPTPLDAWISLGYSTLQDEELHWEWIRQQCAGGKILKTIDPIKSQVKGIIVPVFDGGHCFYNTTIEPFSGVNERSDSDEKALNELITIAKHQGVPIYLAVNVLGWSKISSNGESYSNVFSKDHDWRTVTKTREYRKDSQIYASPFNPDVRLIMQKLIKELSDKFPDIAGVLIDLKLSDKEMLGYSETDRQASINEIGVDPVDFAENGIIVQRDYFQKWIIWRNAKLTAFLKKLVMSYGRNDKDVYISGRADQYGQYQIKNLRSCQDWLAWADTGLVKGVFLEADWKAYFSTANRFNQYFERESNQNAADKKSVKIIPTLWRGPFADNSYFEDWVAIKSHNKDVVEVVFSVQNDQDMLRAIAVTTSNKKAVISQSPIVGEVFKHWWLSNPLGKLYSSEEQLGEHATVLLVNGMPNIQDLFIKRIKQEKDLFTDMHIKPIIISNGPISIPNTILNLIDISGAFSNITEQNALLTLDKAGFVRDFSYIATQDEFPVKMLKVINSLPAYGLNQLAPRFQMNDSKGRRVKLSDYQDGSNLLLVFFPKSSSYKCTQEIASLRDQHDQFNALDIKILAISTDPANVQNVFAQKMGTQFPFIPDVGRNLSILFGAATSTDDTAQRKTIFIDKHGYVRLIDTNVNPETHGIDILDQIRKLGLLP